jgi:hypothetical protein
MRPRPLPEVPEQTVVVARAAFRKGSLAMRVRDELGEVFEDGAFMEAFAVRGKPGISPAQLAMVTVLQFAENLTDRVGCQLAVSQAAGDEWIYCCGVWGALAVQPSTERRVCQGRRARSADTAYVVTAGVRCRRVSVVDMLLHPTVVRCATGEIGRPCTCREFHPCR